MTEITRTFRQRIHASRVCELTHAERAWFVDLPAGLTPETVMAQDYWAHVAQQFKRKDLIKVFCEDGSWEGEYRVFRVNPPEMLIKPIRITVWEAAPAAIAEDTGSYKVQWNPGIKSFAIIRKDSGAVIKDGLYPKSDAEAYLAKHLSEMKVA